MHWGRRSDDELDTVTRSGLTADCGGRSLRLFGVALSANPSRGSQPRRRYALVAPRAARRKPPEQFRIRFTLARLAMPRQRRPHGRLAGRFRRG